jgi:hypothetical protein
VPLALVKYGYIAIKTVAFEKAESPGAWRGNMLSTILEAPPEQVPCLYEKTTPIPAAVGPLCGA